MMRVISSTMGEAQRKAQEQEQAREDLQRQVIRLLDDVEGAADRKSTRLNSSHWPISYAVFCLKKKKKKKKKEKEKNKK